MKIFNIILIAVFLMVSTFAYAAHPNLTMSSPAFKNGGSIPEQYTCKGTNVNPPLEIKSVPEYTQSLVLIVHDPDAPGADFIHWAVYSIDPAIKTIAENSVPGKELINNFDQFKYSGPCPPGSSTHHYVFDLYALDKDFRMNENGSSQALVAMIQGHILDKAELTGVYKIPVMHIFLACLPFLFFVAIFVLILVINKSPMKKKVKSLGGTLNTQGGGLITVDGKPILLQYTPPSRNSAAKFYLSVADSFGAALTIRQETAQDRFYKKIGLNKEPQLFDPDLNSKFYFECDIEEYVKQLFLNPEVKPLVLQVLSKFTSIVITKKMCMFQLSPSPSLDHISEGEINEAARQLLALQKNIPKIISNLHPELASFNVWRFVAYFIAGVSSVCGFATFLWANISFRVIDSFAFWNVSLIWSLLTIVIVSAVIFFKIKGFATSSRVLIYFMLMFSIGCVFSFRFGGAVLNGLWDQSVIENYDELVINKYTTHHKSSTYYHVTVQPWHERKDVFEFTVNSAQYAQVKPGVTQFRVSTRLGYYHAEWIKSINRIVTDANASFVPRGFSALMNKRY